MESLREGDSWKLQLISASLAVRNRNVGLPCCLKTFEILEVKTRSPSISLVHPAFQTLNVIFLLPQQSQNGMNSITLCKITPFSRSFLYVAELCPRTVTTFPVCEKCAFPCQPTPEARVWREKRGSAGLQDGDEVFCEFCGEHLMPSLPLAQKPFAARPSWQG